MSYEKLLRAYSIIKWGTTIRTVRKIKKSLDMLNSKGSGSIRFLVVRLALRSTTELIYTAAAFFL